MQSIKYPYVVFVENKGKHFVAGPIIVKAVNWERIAGQSHIALRLIVTFDRLESRYRKEYTTQVRGWPTV